MDVPQFWNPVRNWLHLQESGLPHGGSGVSDNYREKEEQRCDGYTFDHRRTMNAWYRHWIELPQEIAGKACCAPLRCCCDGCGGVLQWRACGEQRRDVRLLRSRPDAACETGQESARGACHGGGHPDGSATRSGQVARAVSVDITNAMLHSLPHGMFGGTEGGIWQPVTLTITNPVHIDGCVRAGQHRRWGHARHLHQPYRRIRSGGPSGWTITPRMTAASCMHRPRGMEVEIPARDSATFTYPLSGLSPDSGLRKPRICIASVSA